MPDMLFSSLTLSAGFTLPEVNTRLSLKDTMYDGSSDHYLSVGLSALRVIEAAIGDSEPAKILDLPCGFGRVTRILRARFPKAKITACDLDRQAVDFTTAEFDARGVYSTPDFRNLEMTEQFDLIWVGSLLTHLPEHQTKRFLDFALRHMQPKCRLIVTTHGEYVARRLNNATYGLSEDAARGLHGQYLTNGYGYRGYDGSPEYGISLAARVWFETLLSGSGLCIESYHERGWDRHQDVLVLRRTTVKSIGFWRRHLTKPFLSQPKEPKHLDNSACALPLPAAEQAAQDAGSVPGFDEQWYCQHNRDVGEAKLNAAGLSGLAHYFAYGWKEGRAPFDPKQTYAQRMPSLSNAWANGIVGGVNRINEAWSVSAEDRAGDVGGYWLAHPAVAARSKTLASGRPDLDAYDRLATVLNERDFALPIQRAVSIGCGFGNLERDLASRGLISQMDAYDIAAGAIVEAKRQAQALGFSNIRYHVADLENIVLKTGSVDVVFAHSSVHHIEKLEALYAMVQRALRPGGLFHLHEYIGPTRFQWTDAQLLLANDWLDSLPARLRRQPDGEMKSLRRPTIEEMIAADPSEAVRSAELVSALDPFFDVVEYRPLGGALAHIALGGIVQNFDPNSPDDTAILEQLFAIEDAAMARSIIGSDFATLTMTAKPISTTRFNTKRKDIRMSLGVLSRRIFRPSC